MTAEEKAILQMIPAIISPETIVLRDDSKNQNQDLAYLMIPLGCTGPDKLFNYLGSLFSFRFLLL